MNARDFYSFKAKNYEYHSGNPYKRQHQQDPGQGGQSHGQPYEREKYPEERSEGQNQNRDNDYDGEDDWYHQRHQTPPQEDPFPPPRRDYNRQYSANETENNQYQFNPRQQAQSETISRPRLEPLKLQDPFKLPSQQDWEQEQSECYEEKDHIRENRARAPTGIASSKLSSFLPYGYGFGGRGPQSQEDEDEGKTPPPRRERETFEQPEIISPAVIERAAELVAKKLVDQNHHFKKYPDEPMLPIASSSSFVQGKFIDSDNVASSSASSNQGVVSTPTEIITGNVSQFQPDSFGMVGTEIFFMASAVVGRLPQTGDKVVVEAERVSGMPFKFSAKRVQVVSKDLSESSDREREVKRPRQQPPPPTQLNWNLKLDPLPQERELNFGPLPEMPKSLNLLTRGRSPPTPPRFKQGPVVSEELDINWELPAQSHLQQQQVSFNAHSLEPLPVWEVKPQASLPVWSAQNQQNQPVNFPPPIIIHDTPKNEAVYKERPKPKKRSRSRSHSRRRHSRSRSWGRKRSRSRSNSKLRRRRTRSRSDSTDRRHRTGSRSDSKVWRHRTRSKSPRSRKSRRSRSHSPINRNRQRSRSYDRMREGDDEIQIVRESIPGSNRQLTTVERKPKRIPRSIQAQIRHHILDAKKPIEERFVPNPMAKKLAPQAAFEKQLNNNNMWNPVPQNIEEKKSSKKKKIQEVQEPAYKIVSKDKKNQQKAPIEQILIEPIPLNPQEAETQQRITQIKILLGEQQLSKIEEEEKRLLMQQRILHAELFRNKHQVQGVIQHPAFNGGPQVIVPAQQVWPVSSGRNMKRFERRDGVEDGREVERSQRGKEGPVRRIDVDEQYEHPDDVRRESRNGRRSDENEKVKRSPKKSELPISWELPSKTKNSEKSNVNWELPSQWKNRQTLVDNSKLQMKQHEQHLNLREQEIFQRMTDIREQQQTKPKVDWDRFAFKR